MSTHGPEHAPITFILHPPERGRTHPSVPVCAGPGCCCCCCCCLHSAGGLLGAAVGSALASLGRPTENSVERESEELLPSANEPPSLSSADGWHGNRPSAVFTFWLTLLVLILLGNAIGFFMGLLDGNRGNLLYGVVLTLLFFPLVQLLAIVIACLIVIV
jgi:hypothetical protein